MIPRKAFLTRLGLDALYFSGIYNFFKVNWRGVGLIFTLHHVASPDSEPAAEFSPNRILTISPEFLEQTIIQVIASGYDIIDLTEARRRLVENDFRRRFVCFTMDDGYQDNFAVALPIFRKHNVPFTVYVATGIIDGTAILWWEHLEEIVRQQEKICVTLAGRQFDYPTITTEQKYQAFDAMYWHLRSLSQEEQQAAVAALLQEFDIDPQKLCEQCAMTWETLAELAREELVTIGAHTVSHYALSKLSPEEVRDEVVRGRQLIAEKLGISPADHFAYPFGDVGSAASREFKVLDELGLATSTTTRKGLLFPEHKDHLHALPRVSLNGDYQKNRYVRLFLSGAPFALWRRFRKLDVC
jgi:peptidoglycan/xylan/chitin deacetylase (PgdA/CDA1 family)